MLGCSSRQEVERFVRSLKSDDIAFIEGHWPTFARDDQLPLKDGELVDFRVWLMLGGRGAGKTRAGAEWVRHQALGLDLADRPARRIALVGPTLAEARSVMVEGVSGLLAVHRADERPTFEPSLRRLTWPTGAVAHIFSAEEPDSLRGPQFDAAWCDELAKWRYPQAAWDMLQFGLRLGEAPRLVVTTTPRPIPLLKRLLAENGTLVTRARTADNRGFLAATFVAEMEVRYGGTQLGRQELNGELIEDDPAALFRRDLIEANRVRTAPELLRVVVAVDPPATAGPGASACGIVCAGLGSDGRAYVLDDATIKSARPAAWASRAVALYHARGADRLIAEVNQGGDMVEAVIREVDETVAFKGLSAARGKRTRAEPVAALYEQGRVAHVGAFPELEDELVAFDERVAGSSPDRADALVWAVTELLLGRRRPVPRVRVV